MDNNNNWTTLGLVLVIGNWGLGLEITYLLSKAGEDWLFPIPPILWYAPAAALTLALCGWTRNPAALKKAVPAAAAAGLAGSAVSALAWTAEDFTRPVAALGLAWLGLSVWALARTGVREGEGGGDPGLDRLLKYLILINFFLMIYNAYFISVFNRGQWWLAVAAVALGLITLGLAWMIRPFPGLTAALAGVQTAALVTLSAGRAIFSPYSVGSVPALMQFTVSAAGLFLAAVIAVIAVRMRAKRPPLAGPVRVGLAMAAGVLIAWGVLAVLCVQMASDRVDTVPYTGPLKTVQVGRLEIDVPIDTDAPKMSVEAEWPDGVIELDDQIYKPDRPGSEQFQKVVAYEEAKSGAARDLDEYFQLPARLFFDESGKGKLFLQYPAGAFLPVAQAGDRFPVKTRPGKGMDGERRVVSGTLADSGRKFPIH